MKKSILFYIIKYTKLFTLIVGALNSIFTLISWFNSNVTPIILIEGMFFSTFMTIGAFFSGIFNGFLFPIIMLRDLGLITKDVTSILSIAWLFIVLPLPIIHVFIDPNIDNKTKIPVINFASKISNIIMVLYPLMLAPAIIANVIYWILYAWSNNDNYSILLTGFPTKASQWNFIAICLIIPLVYIGHVFDESSKNKK